MMDSSRSFLIYGEKPIKKLENSSVILFGVGGVGGSVLESLVRHGVGNITIVDFDEIVSSNMNRQIQFTSSDIGKYKVDAARDRVLSINPLCNIITINERYGIQSTLQLDCYDYVIDAIDDINAKVLLVSRCQAVNTKLIMSGGMGNRIDPSQIRIVSLANTEGDPLAKKLRTELRKQSLDVSKVRIAFSTELPIRRETPVGSTYSCPNAAGILIAQEVINSLLKMEDK